MCELIRSSTGIVSLSAHNDARLVELLCRLVRSQVLVIVREGVTASKVESSSLSRQRHTVRAIHRETPRLLSYQGRQYQLVADADLGKVPDRDSFEVVPHDEAIRVLDGLIKQSDPPLVKLLDEARVLLTPDWRPPLAPAGVILLQRIMVRSSSRAGDESPRQKTRPGAMQAESVLDAPVAPEPDTLGALVDQSIQADVLMAAARDGVPFCEECARAAAATAA
jgi:hypothetical protein